MGYFRPMISAVFVFLFAITAVEFNLQWTGTENQPNWFKALDSNGSVVTTTDSWEKRDGVYFWNVYLDGKLLTYLNFWEE